jgi:trans-aconitate methyltransferase
MWDPAIYRRFGAERSRPFADLVARIGAEAPRAVTDLGCGPGELTLTLAGRWPAARLSGVDSSAEMIEKATAHVAGYAALLTAAGAAVDAWETTYVHLLADDGPEHPVLRWMEGTALRPVKAALDENAWQSFRADLAAELAAAYPAAHGHVAFPFRRIFVVARTAV